MSKLAPQHFELDIEGIGWGDDHAPHVLIKANRKKIFQGKMLGRKTIAGSINPSGDTDTISVKLFDKNNRVDVVLDEFGNIVHDVYLKIHSIRILGIPSEDDTNQSLDFFSNIEYHVDDDWYSEQSKIDPDNFPEIRYADETMRMSNGTTHYINWNGTWKFLYPGEFIDWMMDNK